MLVLDFVLLMATYESSDLHKISPLCTTICAARLLFLFFIFFIFEMEHPIPLISSTNLLASIIRAIPTSVVWNSVIVHHKPQGHVLNYYRSVGHTKKKRD
jgi:hypothetical protein